jgi:hypothetical protein
MESFLSWGAIGQNEESDIEQIQTHVSIRGLKFFLIAQGF